MNTHNISWGKIVVGAAIAAGAVAAFIAVEPFLEQTVVPALKSLASTIGSAIADAWSWLGQHIVGSADVNAIKAADVAASQLNTAKEITTLASSNSAFSAVAEKIKDVMPLLEKAATTTAETASAGVKGVVGLIMQNPGVAIGTAATAGGLIAARSHNGQPMPLPEEITTPQPDGFAMREDIKRMNALLQARMAAIGQGGMAPGFAR